MAEPRDYEGARVLGLTGAENSLADGGGVFFRLDGELYWQWWYAPLHKRYRVFTAPIPKDVLKKFPVDTESLTGQSEYTEDELFVFSVSEDPHDRVRVMEVISDVYGGRELDDEPEQLTEDDLDDRWSEQMGMDDRRDDDELEPEFDQDEYEADDEEEEIELPDEMGDSDYFLRENEDEQWDVFDGSGEHLSEFEDTQSALLFIAEQMLETGPGAVFYTDPRTGELGQFEDFDPESVIARIKGDGPRRRRRRRPEDDEDESPRRSRRKRPNMRESSGRSASEKRRRRIRVPKFDAAAYMRAAQQASANFQGMIADGLFQDKDES